MGAAPCRTQPDASIGEKLTNKFWRTADNCKLMSDDAKKKERFKMSEYEIELRIAKSLELICRPPVDTGMARVTALKEQLVALFLRLEHGEISSTDAKAQSVDIREELSKMIWSVEDWQTQSESRN
jgi:hypothetical protein